MTDVTSSTDTERCSECGDPIEGQPLYKSSDVTATEDGLEFVENPDGPFCGVPCRREFDDSTATKEDSDR